MKRTALTLTLLIGSFAYGQGKIQPPARDAKGQLMLLTRVEASVYCKMQGQQVPSDQDVSTAWASGALESDGNPLGSPGSPGTQLGDRYVWFWTTSVWTSVATGKPTTSRVIYYDDKSGGLASSDSGEDANAVYGVRCQEK